MRSIRAILLLALLAFGLVAQAAGRVFYDGFEDGTTNAWSPGSSSGYYAKCDVVSTALDAGVGPYAGTKMARCNWDGTAGTFGHRSQEMIKAGWSKTRESFIRWKIRVDSDVDNKPGSKLFRAPGNISFAAIQFELGSSASLFSTIFKSNNQQIGSTNWGCGGPFRDGAWHEIEIYLNESTSGASDGTVRIWVDGSLCWEATSVNTDDPEGSSYWADFHMMSNWSITEPGWDHDANNHVYWDEFEIYSDTGTGGSGSMSAGTMTQGAGGLLPGPTNYRRVPQ